MKSLLPALLPPLLAAGVAAGESGPWRHLNEPDIRRALPGARLEGAARSVYRIRADGTFELQQPDRRVRGRWHIERDEVCLLPLTTPAASEECFEVQQRGEAVRLLQDGYIVLQGSSGASPSRKR